MMEGHLFLLLSLLIIQHTTCQSNNDDVSDRVPSQNIVNCGTENIVDLKDATKDRPIRMRSPRLPNSSNYPPNQDCNYRFLVPADHTLVLSVRYLSFGGQCGGWDTLDWTLDRNTNVKWCKDMSKKNFNFMPINKYYIVSASFISDAKKSAKGFEIDLYLLPGMQHSNPSTYLGQPSPIQPPASHYRRCGFTIGENVIPWQVTLMTKDGESYCFGVLISEHAVLTSKACVSAEEDLKYVMINYGSRFGGNVRHEIICTKIHPEHHLALVILKNPVDFSTPKTVAPICLPQNIDRDYTGQILHVTGWDYQHNLVSHNVMGLNNSECSVKNLWESHTNGICAGFHGYSSQDCFNGIGIPLSITVTGITTVIGFVYYGPHCIYQLTPVMYSRVDSALPWIINNSFNRTYENQC